MNYSTYYYGVKMHSTGGYEGDFITSINDNKYHLTFQGLDKIIHPVLFNNINNVIIKNYKGEEVYSWDWDIISGTDQDDDGNYDDVFQWYIFNGTNTNLQLLKEAEQLIYYIPGLNCYIWAVKFYGTSWGMIDTGIIIPDNLIKLS